MAQTLARKSATFQVTGGRPACLNGLESNWKNVLGYVSRFPFRRIADFYSHRRSNLPRRIDVIRVVDMSEPKERRPCGTK